MRLALIALAPVALLLAAPPGARAASVADLAWMTGTWVEAKGGRVVREAWLPAMGGQMVGVSQEGSPGRAPSWEFERIEARDGVLVFTATLPGQPPTDFTLVPTHPGEAVFENKTHDFPQRVIYRRCGADLCARIEGTIGGKAEGQDWRYRRERR